jgi:hypothetical protein
MNPRFGIFPFAVLIFMLSITACSNKKIEITSEYIINENWSRENEQAWANSITITRMKLKPDSVFNPLTDLTHYEVLNKLEEDKMFIYYTNVRLGEGESYNNKKIYFNRDNGFYWGKGGEDGKVKVKTIGTLQKDNWYRFSYLGSLAPRFIYIYIDSTNHAHRFDVSQSNY